MNLDAQPTIASILYLWQQNALIAHKFIKLQNSMAQKGNHINNLDH
jgi:hypothetical protein